MLPFSPRLLPADLRDERVLTAMRALERGLFVPPDVERAANEEDVALAIGYGQTISQPYIVAYMSAALRVSPGDRVLEIGTGSGYQAAVLAKMGVEVFSVELIPELSRRAELVLAKLGLLDRVHLHVRDGRHGLPKHAPYDGVICTAAPANVPPALIEQLKLGRRLVVPVGGAADQQLLVLERDQERMREVKKLSVRFVPLVKPDVLA